MAKAHALPLYRTWSNITPQPLARQSSRRKIFTTIFLASLTFACLHLSYVSLVDPPGSLDHAAHGRTMGHVKETTLKASLATMIGALSTRADSSDSSSSEGRTITGDGTDAEGADDTIFAHSQARFEVIKGIPNSTSCLPIATDSQQEGTKSSSSHVRPALVSSGPNHAVSIVAGLSGGLIGLFVAILAALAWHGRKENLRRYPQGEGDADSLDHLRRVNVVDRRPFRVAVWDRQYRNSPRAGWNYMTSLVPGLRMGEPSGFNAPGPSPAIGSFSIIAEPREAALPSRRRKEQKADPPSYYGESEEVTKGLSSYELGLSGYHFPATAETLDQESDVTQERYEGDAGDSFHEERRLTRISEQDGSDTSPAESPHYLSSPSPHSTHDLLNASLHVSAPVAEVGIVGHNEQRGSSCGHKVWRK
ncbi:hypothetical protein BCV69DRAFT_304478 [Microstroma glucosiphilum]|uniref:Uncharacterized protein n=1 Tax=Pseudomicrostroma glucosiphilum TaxID=1684307 RepID=A0A316TZF4_9BASI|nr:hypothetical protein BCV69DRAFT_304478 [Pseudomicrostroma glucosiphilum]PWN18370.1 hypothetical protein BCV69DRAFT_304478 [Pseudomicrostroma glucosiphilum]